MLKFRFCWQILSLILVLGVGCSKEARLQRHLSRGNSDFGVGRYQTAEIEYLAALKLASTEPIAVKQLGIIYQEDGQLLRAFAFLKKAAELSPNDTDVHLRMGLIYLSFHQFKEARDEADWVLMKKPGHEEALLMLPEMALKPEEIKATRQYLAELRRKDQDRAVYHTALATLSLRQSDLSQAEVEIDRALTLDPKSNAAHLALGNLKWARNDFDGASQAFKAAVDSATMRSPTRLKLANFQIKTGRIEDAKQMLEALTQEIPDYLPAWNVLMQVAFVQKNFDQCASLARNILARDPVNFDALMMTGNLHLVKNEGDEAVKCFERMRTTYDDIPQVQYQLALAHVVNEEPREALRYLDRALQINSDYTEAILLRAELNLRSDSVTAAIVSLTRLTKDQPQIQKAHFLLATAFLLQKNPDEALAVYRRMLSLFPQSPEVPTHIASVLIQQNKFGDAAKAAQKALDISPSYLPAIEELIDIEIQRQNYAGALERLKTESNQMPRQAALWLMTAKVYVAQKDYTQAESALLKAINADPNAHAGYLLLAQVFINEHKQKDALERLNSLVVKTNDLVAWMQIGMIHQDLKQFPEARDAYKKALGINADFIPALNNLAYLYSEHLGDLDRAAKLAQHARKLLPDDPFTADTYGWILYKKGDYAHALALIVQSASRLSDQPEVQFHLGMTYYMLGQEESARVALLRAADSTSDFWGKGEARDRLALLDMDLKTAGPDILQEFEKKRAANPNDPILLDHIATLYEREGGATDKVRGIYETILQQNPNNVQAMIKLARCYGGPLKDPVKALDLAKNAHKLAPDDTGVSETLAQFLTETDDGQWAVSLLQEAVRKVPDDPNLRYELAWALYRLGHPAEAEASMRAALSFKGTFGSSADAKRFLQMVESAKSPSATSAAQAREVLAASPNYLPALMVLAVCANQQGDYNGAKEIYEMIVTANRHFSPAWRNLALLYFEHFRDDRKAYPAVVSARTLQPEDYDLGKALGILTYNQGEYSRAVQLLADTTQQRSEDAEVLCYLGMAQYKMKQQNESRQTLQRALALTTIPPALAGEAKRLLSEIK